MTSTDNILLIDRSDPAVARITLNRPAKRNALSLTLIEAIQDAVRVASDDRACRVIQFHAAGPSFCAGLDLHEAAESGTAERSATALAEMYEAICLSPLITIAVARGAAMGGGAGLLAACDFVVAADDLRLAYPEVKRGLVAAAGELSAAPSGQRPTSPRANPSGTNDFSRRSGATRRGNSGCPRLGPRFGGRRAGDASSGRSARGDCASKRLLDEITDRPISEALAPRLELSPGGEKFPRGRGRDCRVP